MAARLSTSQLARVIPCSRPLLLASRPLSTSSARPAPPKKIGGKPVLWGKKKGAAGEEDAAAGGQGLGNVLDEVTLPAPDLSALPVLQPETLTADAVGDVRAFSTATLATFKALSIPPLLEKEFSFSRRPATVVRGATLEASAILDAAKKSSSKDSRHVITGPAGSGKSVLLLQTLAYAQATGWVVLYLPSATPALNSSTPHVYSSTQAIFDQPALSLQLLTKFTAANKAAFKALRTRKEWTFGDRVVKAGTGLDELATKGVDEKTSASVLEALFDELAAQKTHPVLLGVDDSQALFATSSYVDPTYEAIESFSLSVPRLLLEYISGAKAFTNGSVMIAPSLLSTRKSPAMTRFLGAEKSTASSAYTPVGTSFDTYSEVLSGLNQLAVPPRLERKEAVGVVRMLQGWRGIREIVSDQTFLERYVATDGSPRHFRRSLEKSVEV